MLRVFSTMTLILCLVTGCHRSNQIAMKSRLAMGDPEIAQQLVSGFYEVEDHRWRWTARQFVITFPGSTQTDPHKPHILKLNVFVPEGQIEKLGPLTLTADVNGSILESETFRRPGLHSYVRNVPPLALESNILPVVFFLDKFVPASPGGRELGLVVNDAQLTVN